MLGLFRAVAAKLGLPFGRRAFAAFMPFPVPGDEVQSAAQRSWMWENAEAEVTKARAHVLVTAMGPGPDTKYRVEHDRSSFVRGQKVLRLHIP